MAIYKLYRLQISLRDHLLLCLAYYPPKSGWRGGTRLVRAAQDPVGVGVPQDKPNKHTLLCAESFPSPWSRPCFPGKADSPQALISEANNCESPQYWEQMQQSG